MSDNELFWEIVKTFFSNKGNYRSNIKLVEGNKLLQDNSEAAEELNKFFEEGVSTLDINESSYIINPGSIISEPVEKSMSKYTFYPSFLLINDKMVNQDKFSFKPISKLDIEK